MSDTAATLDILIDIRAKLEELSRGSAEMRTFTEETAQANKQANSLASAFRTGLGIDLVRRGLDLLTGSIRDAANGLVTLARETVNQSRALGITTEGYQVLRDLLGDTGGDIAALTQATNQQRQSMLAARDETSSSAAAYRALGLDLKQLEQMPLEQRFEAIGRALTNSKDQTAAYRAAAEVLGARTLPQLTNALQELATKGYAQVAAEARDSGKVLDDWSLSRVREAEKMLNDAKQKLTVIAGESVGFYSLLLKAAYDDWRGLMDAYLNGQFSDKLASYLPQNKPAAAPPNVQQQIPLSQLPEWQKQQLELTKAQNDQAVIAADNVSKDTAKRAELVPAIWREIEARTKLLDLAKRTPLAPGETQAQRDVLIEQQQAGVMMAYQSRENTMFRQSAMQRRVNNPGWMNPENPVANPNKLSMGEGLVAGAGDWVTEMGSRGEQVAAAMQSSIGATVQSISQGIYGWITGTQSFGDAMMNLGSTILQTMLQTIIQMGVQWLINTVLIKTGMIGIEATGDALRAGRVVKENAAEAATLPMKTAGATASGISSYGISLAFGALAIALILGAMAAFDVGGYTGNGNRYEPAGVVHRGEVVFSQSDVARHGGAGAVEALRLGGPQAALQGVPVPAPVSSRPAGAAAPLAAGAMLAAAMAASAAQQKPSRTVVVDNRRVADQLRDDPAFFTLVQDMVTGNPSAFGIPS